jgi:cell shape-determining protein MreD
MNSLNLVILMLAALVVVFLQSTVEVSRDWLGAQVDLLPALIVYASLTHGILAVALVATAGGLWFDSLSANPLGISILPLFLVGFAIFRSRAVLLREHTYAQFVLGLGASAAVPLAVLLSLFSLEKNPLLGWGTLWQLLVMTLAGGVATPILFRLFDRMQRAFNYQVVPERILHADREIKRGRL